MIFQLIEIKNTIEQSKKLEQIAFCRDHENITKEEDWFKSFQKLLENETARVDSITTGELESTIVNVLIKKSKTCMPF